MTDSFGLGGKRTGIACFGEVNHFSQLVLDMGGFGRTVVYRHQRCGTDQDIGNADLTASIAGTVIIGEYFNKPPRIFGLAAHENIFPGDENIIKNYICLLSSKIKVSNINGAALYFPR